MRLKLAAFVIGSMLMYGANAASWEVIKTVDGQRAVYFFDLDTIVKRSTGVTFWIKAINSESTPDKDGSYSTAMKYNIDCNKHTLQALTMVTYDRNQIPMQTLTTPADPAEAIPGTIGEALVKVVCAKDFPSKQAADYMPVTNNDIYGFTRAYFSYKHDPAPK